MNDMTKQLISIIVPIYNVEPYLKRCLDSIINQTYQNLEIILVDDGSADRSGRICDDYAAKDSRIIVIHQKNAGISAARNAGIDIAKGDYIQFVDSDDWLDIRCCEVALSELINVHADFICYGFNEHCYNGNIISHVAKNSEEKEKRLAMKYLIWQRGDIRDNAWNKLYAKKLFDGIRYPVGMVYEDIGTIYKLLHKANHVYVSNQILYNYVRRPDSIEATHFSYQSYIDRKNLYEERVSFLQQHYPDYINLQLTIMLREIIIQYIKSSREEYFQLIQKDLDDFTCKYHEKLKYFTHYTKLTWFYYYFRPIFPLIIKLRG